MKVAINGFGRIGRLSLRAIFENNVKDIEVVAINDLGDAGTNAHLFKYDSVHGTFNGDVAVDGNYIVINGHKIQILSERDPAKLPWKELGIDLVYECTGIFTSKDKSMAHINAGAKRVLVSAPCNDADKTVVFGINNQTITKDDLILSNASCTTNCLSPVVFALNKEIGFERGYMTTIHSYTGDQPMLDTYHKDKKRARAGAMSMIPTSTGAAKAVGLILPELAGKIQGSAVRVPTPNVSLVDLTFIAKKETTKDDVNNIMKKYAEGELKNILGYSSEELVSIDFCHKSYSSIFDSNETTVVDKNFIRVVAWYDNEWGFSCRMSDVASYIAQIDG